MPLRIELDNGRYCPVTICDYCGQRIAGPGNFEWRCDEKGQVVDGAIYFTHKHCTRQFRDARGGQAGWMWAELDHLPVYVLASMGITSPTAILEVAKRVLESPY